MKRIHRQEIYHGSIIHVYRDYVMLENGSETVREVVAHREAAAVVAVDDKDRILLVRQHRYAIDQYQWELPAGLLDAGEAPEAAARRELLEETGYTAEKMELLLSFYSSPGCHDEKIHIFKGTGLKRQAELQLDQDELLTAHERPFQAVLEEVKRGTLQDGKTVIGVLLYAALCSR